MYLLSYKITLRATLYALFFETASTRENVTKLKTARRIAMNTRFTHLSRVSARTDASQRRGGRGAHKVCMQFHMSDFGENCRRA